MSLASGRSNLELFAALSDREVLLQARILRIDSEGRSAHSWGASRHGIPTRRRSSRS